MDDSDHEFQLAAWTRVEIAPNNVIMVPLAFEVSNIGEGYSAKPLMREEFTTSILERRAGKDLSRFPIWILSTGYPRRYTEWIAKVGNPEFSKLVGAQVPFGSFDAVVDYVRFLIRMVSDLYRVARQPGIVGEPVETLVLLPEGSNTFSVRY
jgi:hypothetical protein